MRNPGIIFRAKKNREELLILLAIFAIAVFLRLYDLDSVPPALTYDEAANGLDAIEVAEGRQHPVFFHANSGREPLFIYLQAVTVLIFGANPITLRLPAVVIGVLTVPATYLLIRAMFMHKGPKEARWIATLTSFWLTISYYHLNFSRMGLTMVPLPLLQTCAFYVWWLGRRSGKAWQFGLAGALLGLCLYTYPASRFLPVFLIVFLALSWLRRSLTFAFEGRNVTLFVTAFVLILVPLVGYFISHPEDFLWRAGQVSLFNAEVNEGNFPRALAANLLKTSGMFNVYGDDNYPISNLSGRPIFDIPSSILFLIGVGISLKKTLTRKPSASPAGTEVSPEPYLFALLWAAVMLLPTVLSSSAPNFHRTIGVIPIVFVFPALGLLALWHRVCGGSRTRQRVFFALALILFSFSAYSTFYDYFVVWAKDINTHYAFDCDEADIAGYINRQAVQHRVYTAPIFRSHATAAFYTRGSRFKSFEAVNCTVIPLGLDRDAIYVFPPWDPFAFSQLSQSLDSIALAEDLLGCGGNPLLTVYRLKAGTLSQETWHSADQASLPFLSPQHRSSTTLEGGIEFQGYTLEGSQTQPGQPIHLNLFWHATTKVKQDYMVFVHLVDEEGRLWGQWDGPPCNGSYLTSIWEKDELIIDRYPYNLSLRPEAPPGRYQIKVGLYSLITGERLKVLDRAGNPQGQEIVLTSIQVDEPRSLSAKHISPQHPLKKQITPDLNLLGYDLAAEEVERGGNIRLALYWKALQDISHNYTILLQLARDSQLTTEMQYQPFAGLYPTSRWEEGDTFRDEYLLPISLDADPGTHTVSVSVLDDMGRSQGQANLGSVEIAAKQRHFEMPNPQHPMHINLDGKITFLGYDLRAQEINVGEVLNLTLYWQAQKRMGKSYTVFTHLLDTQNQIWGQKDSIPVSGNYPTTDWWEGEVVVDEYEIPLRTDAPAGEYRIEIGIYDAMTGERLSVFTRQGQRLSGNRILLETPVKVRK
jgi:4-amino-4-deoxy-L-arabinose transferase-like glycosyltransferase